MPRSTAQASAIPPHFRGGNSLGNSVKAVGRWRREPASLYAANGARKYLNAAERERVLVVMQNLPPAESLFALTLAWTGARVSEVLALTPASFQIDAGVVAVVTLKRRRFVVREVPVPPELMVRLDQHFRLSAAPPDGGQLWPWCRVTAWRLIKDVMRRAGVEGRRACPRGLRHSFGIAALQAQVPLNLAQRWLGHAHISTTAIYAAACGPEEIAFAERLWRGGL
jgi:integrase/recombinase XerD